MSFETGAGELEVITERDDVVWRWTPTPGKSSTLSLREDHPAFARLRYFDLFAFEMRIASGNIASIGFQAVGHVTGPRQYKVHSFTLARLSTPTGVWHSHQLDLARPFWFAWDNRDGLDRPTFFRFNAMALSPGTVIEIRKPRLNRQLLYLKPDYIPPITWPRLTRHDSGDATYSIDLRMANTSGTPGNIDAALVSEHEQFEVTLDKTDSTRSQRRQGAFTLKASLTADQLKKLPELYHEPVRVRFVLREHPEAVHEWAGHLVRPLSDKLNRQVVIPPAMVEPMRKALADPDHAFGKAIQWNQTLQTADSFLDKQLLTLPRAGAHVRNGWPGPWRPTDRMPEAKNTQTGETEFGTPNAAITWKEYLALAGQAPTELGVAHLLTADPKYAARGIELLEVFAEQYTTLQWHLLFDVPWYDGATIQTSARYASNSSYGTNWYFKWICEMASMIADAEAWTPQTRQRVYGGFVLPYVTELTKMQPPISNMSDITARNLVLLGLAFDDATALWHGTMSDTGVIRRLADLDAQGFSSEGRPLNYHRAAMTEYVATIGYLESAGLDIEYPKQNLLEAVRMPYQRASLWGSVPNAGDSGRWQSVGVNAIAAKLARLFPDEPWLLEVGNRPDRVGKWLAMRRDIKPGAGDWKKLVPTEPVLFEDAGLAILRQGNTADQQIMVTLDYGASLFHGHLDRNQITLSAFGKTFTHGTGSLYNVGRGGMNRNRDANLEAFVKGGSLGNNVILVDSLDQLPAVGELMQWSDQPARQVAVARVSGIAPGVEHTRGVMLSKGVIVVLDRVASAQRHTYDFVYHNFGELTPAESWTATPVDAPLAESANYPSITNLRQLTGDGILKLTWNLANPSPDSNQKASQVGLNLWQMPIDDSTAYLGVTGMNNPNTKTVPDAASSLIRRVKANVAHFVTVLEPTRGESKVASVKAIPGDAEDDAVGVRVKLEDGSMIEWSIHDWATSP